MSTLGVPLNQRPVIEKKASPAIWIIIIIVVLIVVAVAAIILVWWLTRRAAKPGVGGTCTVAADCATGLTCTGGLCALPDCPKPGQVSNIDDEQEVDGGAWDVTLTWDAETAADFYIVFVGEDEDFDPEEEAVAVFLTDTNEFVAEDVPVLTDVYIRIRAGSENCGLGAISDEYHFETGAIM